MLKILGYVFAALVILLGSFYFYASKRSSTIVATRTFNAPVEKVWEYWTAPTSIKNWWGPKHYTAPIIQNDLRVGSSYLYAMKSPKGDIAWNTGKYKEIDPLKKIVATVSFADETATPISAAQAGVPGNWIFEVLLTVEFENLNGKTLVRVTETGIPMLMSVLAKMGWNQQFDKFEKLLNTRSNE